MKYIFIIIFFINSVYSQAQTYEGKIGKHPIFLELDMDYDDNRVTAFYFYKSQLKNINLEGTYDNSEITLFEKFSIKEEKKELFLLSIKNNKIVGTWQNKGKELNVKLRPTTTNFEEFKLLKLEFIRDSIATYDKKELVWFTEKYSKKTLFRLGNGFTNSQREFLNQKLDSIHTNYAIIGLECDWADINTEIELVSNQYISFSEYSNIYCGGAHPSYNTLGYNFDYKNNLQLHKLTDIYPTLNHYQLLKEKYDNDSEQQVECEYFTQGEELWEYSSWVLTKEGVTITPSFPHAMTPCETGFPLTYDELNAFR
ncbi:hypothetical protein [Flavobacterium sp.]|uniref:hypothetical protein n=1 Tax=Flavobacterium sp. TaxID=239 RepID=UPI003D2D9E0E